MRIFSVILVLVCWPLAPAASPQDTDQADVYELKIPLGFPALPPIPEDNPLTPAKVELGRKLFHDPILSSNNKISCATCHKAELNFATNDPVAVGIDDRVGTRNAPSLLNRAYGKTQFWDGRSGSLEDQALQPIENKDEMGTSIDAAIDRLRASSEYRALFAAAFPTSHSEKDSNPINRDTLAKTIACFERTLLIGGSQVDRFRNNDYTALPQEARKGMWVFESKGGCWQCHSTENFSDEDFHNTGVGFESANRDPGLFNKTGIDSDRFRYKTPTLRGAALTAPYMHDGSLKTLEDVVEFYSRGGSPKDPSLDPKLKPLNLTDAEKKQLVAFLKALSE
ncbi:MAG: cytochrome c peroxidase [Pirellulaceae bacterium]